MCTKLIIAHPFNHLYAYHPNVHTPGLGCLRTPAAMWCTVVYRQPWRTSAFNDSVACISAGRNYPLVTSPRLYPQSQDLLS